MLTMNEQTKKTDLRHDTEMTVKAATVQASISSPLGGLYIAADATAYNLEHIRAHVRALDDGVGERIRLSLTLSAGGDPAVVAEIETLAEELRREGIHVRFSADSDTTESHSASARWMRVGASRSAAI